MVRGSLGTSSYGSKDAHSPPGASNPQTIDPAGPSQGDRPGVGHRYPPSSSTALRRCGTPYCGLWTSGELCRECRGE